MNIIACFPSDCVKGLIALGLFACSSGADKSITGATTGGHSSIDASLGSGLTITIKNFEYSPANIGVPAGKTVTVVNQDLEQHSVTSESKLDDYNPGAVDGVQFDTGLIDAGASAQFTIGPISNPGTVIPYYCSVHKSTMVQGSVTVQ